MPASSAAACIPTTSSTGPRFRTHRTCRTRWESGYPTPAEVEWARLAATTPHYVVSRTLTSAKWPLTSFLRGLDEVAALKQQSGKDIYLMGGAEITRACLKAGLVDEFRFIIYPLIAGEGTALFTAPERHGLELRDVDMLSDGRVSLVYGIS